MAKQSRLTDLCRQPPYYAVVFTSSRTAADPDGYEAMAARMEALAAEQPGYLSLESFRDAGGVGVTISCWETWEAAQAWGRIKEHRVAQALGRKVWYKQFRLRVCRVEQDRIFENEEN